MIKLTQTLPYEAYLRLNEWKSMQALLEAAWSQDDASLTDVKEDVERAVAYIMGRFPFFGAFVYRFRFIYVPADDPDVQTMATDGKNIYINPAFTRSMTDKQTIFVICHEILHNVMMHFIRQDSKGATDHERWNVACDYEINPMLVDEGLLSKDEVKNQLRGLYEDQYVGVPAEEIYDRLGSQKMPQLPQQLLDKIQKEMSKMPKTNQPPPPPQSGQGKSQEKPGQQEEKPGQQSGQQGKPQGQPGQGQPGQGQPGQGQPGKEDGEGEGSQGQGGKPSGQGKEAGEGSQGQGGESQGQGGRAGRENENSESNGIGGVMSREKSYQKQKELGVPVELPGEKDAEKLLSEALGKKEELNSSKSRGTGKGLIQRALDRFSKPQVNWKNELRRIIGKMLSKEEEYFGKKKYLHRDEYVYGDRQHERDLKTAIMPVDTSGSMGDDELRAILGEIYSIIRSKKIRKTEVVYFDHGIQGHDIVKNPPRFDWTKAKGGGGTSFIEPIEYITKEYKAGKMELAVFCTDGYGDQERLSKTPKFAKRFVWLIIDNPGFEAPFGKVVHITTKKRKE